MQMQERCTCPIYTAESIVRQMQVCIIFEPSNIPCIAVDKHYCLVCLWPGLAFAFVLLKMSLGFFRTVRSVCNIESCMCVL